MIGDYFKREEFACNCGCGFDTVDFELIDLLEGLREYIRSPVIITSGCRCKEYNARVGGSQNSQHLLGRASDIVVNEVPPEIIQRYLKGKYHGRYGIGSYDNFTHVDTRTNGPARW